jgi:hypothetical protein
MPAFFVFGRLMVRKRYSSMTKALGSFNLWSLYVFGIIVLWTAFTGVLEFAQKRTKGIGNIAVGAIYMLVILFFYFSFGKQVLKLLEEMLKRKEGRKVPWLDPSPTIEGRQLQAQTILSHARKELDPTERTKMIQTVRRLLPLPVEILDLLEEFGAEETDIDVRTKLWQVYEQVDLAVERAKSPR